MRRMVVLLVGATAALTAVAQPTSLAAPRAQVEPPPRRLAGPPSYVVEFLPNPDPDPFTNPLRPSGINEAGEIIGNFDYPYRAFVSDGTRTVLLPNPAGRSFGFGEEINDRRQVAGSSGFDVIEDPQRAVVWSRGRPRVLGTLGGTDSFGYSLNNLGHVVGASYVDPTTTERHPFLWTPGTGMIDLDPATWEGAAFDVNDSTVVTGVSGVTAFRWRAGTLQDLGAPPGFSFSTGLAINERGQVAGYVDDPPVDDMRLARYVDGVGWEVIGGPRDRAALWGINDDGDAVGEATFGGFEYGVVYLDGIGLFRLDDLLATEGWTIFAAYDINNAGQIAAYASSTAEPPLAGAVRLTPLSG